MTHPQHPDLLDLAALVIDEAPDQTVEDHVANCDVCADIVAKLREATLLTQRPEPVGVSLADSVNAALAELPDPAAGQLWRTEWDGAVALVAVLALHTGGDADVAPIIDAEDLDSCSVALTRDVLGWEAAVLAATMVTVPARVFDRYIGHLTDTTLRRVLDVAGGAPGDGPAINDPDDWRLRHHRVAFAELESLAAATWLPEIVIGEVDALDTLKQLWATPRAVADALSVSPGRAMSILDGTTPLTDEWRATIEEAAGVATAQSLPAPALLRALDDVQVRSFWRAAAERRGSTDSPEFRWYVYQNANFAIAARSTGISEQDATIAKIKQVLSELA